MKGICQGIYLELLSEIIEAFIFSLKVYKIKKLLFFRENKHTHNLNFFKKHFSLNIKMIF